MLSSSDASIQLGVKIVSDYEVMNDFLNEGRSVVQWTGREILANSLHQFVKKMSHSHLVVLIKNKEKENEHKWEKVLIFVLCNCISYYLDLCVILFVF